MVQNEIKAEDLILVDIYLDTKKELEGRLKENTKNFYRLIQRLAKEGISVKTLAFRCKLSRARIEQIIHKNCIGGYHNFD